MMGKPCAADRGRFVLILVNFVRANLFGNAALKGEKS
jgi:hypothetical protein